MSDAEALPDLLAAMAAAARHDAEACAAALDRAEAPLGRGFHRSRRDIEAARDALAHGDWRAVHSLAWSATTGLTWAFPPAPSHCPPAPLDQPLLPEGTPCPGCGGRTDRLVRWCPTCGTEQVNPLEDR